MKMQIYHASFRLAIAAACIAFSPVRAHFLVLLPSTDIITSEGTRDLTLDLLFTHPMQQGPVMQMGLPRRFGVLFNEQSLDLLDQLQPLPAHEPLQYRCSFQLRQPADYVFYAEPSPYYEPAEQKMIIHYTKVVVAAFDAQTGWDRLVGFPVEIKPLVRPYGLWTGNLFRGQVLVDGKPFADAEIEVEYWNEGGAVTMPSAPFVTQVIRTDSAGVFSYAMPRQGWWGFAALVDGAEPMTGPDGDPVEVELGGLIWVHTVDMSIRK